MVVVAFGVVDVVLRVDDREGEEVVEGSSAGEEEDEAVVVVAAIEASLWAAWLGRTMYWHCRPKARQRVQGSCPLHFIFWVRQLEQPL